MDNISVPSRFSCLKIEDDEFCLVKKKSSKKKITESKTVNKKNPQNQNISKKLQGKQEQSSNGTSKKSKAAKAKFENQQWEEWQKKDNEYIDENFEQDLQSAILQSKLDYENQKQNPTTNNLHIRECNSAKKKKPKSIPLDQFLDPKSQIPKKELDFKEPKATDQNFFESIIHSTKEEIRKEKIEEKRRERSNNIDEVISLAQCQEKLQVERQLNEQLRKDLTKANEELALVKKRNQQLYSMLSQGEMKDKVTVLKDLEQMTTFKEELTEEVTKLHKLLEQERSKSHNNTYPNYNAEPHNKQKKLKKKS